MTDKEKAKKLADWDVHEAREEWKRSIGEPGQDRAWAALGAAWDAQDKAREELIEEMVAR